MDTLLTYYLVYLLTNLNQGFNLVLPPQQENQVFLDKLFVLGPYGGFQYQ